MISQKWVWQNRTFTKCGQHEDHASQKQIKKHLDL